MSLSDHSSCVDQINCLLNLHSGCLIQHIQEAHPHVDAQTYAIWQNLSQLPDHQKQRMQILVRILTDNLQSQPVPGVFDQNVGFAHFLTLDVLLPQLLTELKNIAQALTTLQSEAENAVKTSLEPAMISCHEDITAVENAMSLIKRKKIAGQ
jgi:hypothetical protein